ncbi:MAG: response regulator transcription factor [Chloroflexi bacterium]|nr:response regulator transcription factor [Chloroflexota bacterium]
MIEDDPAVANSLQIGLERDGFQVTWKNTGASGIEFALQHDPHLILLDIRLPDGSGFDFCRRMRQSGLRQPVMMLTVQREEIDKVLGLEIGADDYMTKPFSLRELISRLRALLRRAYGEYASAEGQVLFVRDLVIDLARGQVRRGEQIINLTPTEFRLLVFLARHPGQALSRGQIVDNVWGYAPDLDGERAVNVHVRRLREKIEPDPGRPCILLTVPGIGYRLVL